jgi:hypothetical protein
MPTANPFINKPASQRLVELPPTTIPSPPAGGPLLFYGNNIIIGEVDELYIVVEGGPYYSMGPPR